MIAYGDDEQAAAMADFAYKDLKARHVVIWTNTGTDFTTKLSRYFEKSYLSRGGVVSAKMSYHKYQKDFRPLIEKLKVLSSPPDAIFIAGNPEDCPRIREATA